MKLILQRNLLMLKSKRSGVLEWKDTVKILQTLKNDKSTVSYVIA
jgi:hypothetical protein